MEIFSPKVQWVAEFIALGMAGISLMNCGSNSTPAGTTVTTRLANSALTGTTVTSLRGYEPDTLAPFSTFFAVGDSASSTVASLTSLKYIFGQMQICQDLTVTGSAFSGGTGCISLYDSGIDPSTITASTFSSFAAKTVDLMSATSLATFNAAASGSVTAGSYKYVSINWAPYIAVTGTVTVGGGSILKTQACTVNATTGLCKSSTNLASATSAVESVVKSANGGSWFKFQNPFVISQADVDAKTAYSIDMVFNPDSAIAANKSTSPSGGFYWGQIADVDPGTTGNSIYVLMIQLTPVPKAAGGTTSKETYTLVLPSNAGTARVELYFQKTDTSKTIYGVNILNTLSTANDGTFTQIDVGAKVATIETAASGAVTLKSTDGTAIITGLTRRANSTVTINYLGSILTSTAGIASTYVNTVDLK